MGNQHYDAEIEITGFIKDKFKVEVITDENEKSVFRRLKLAKMVLRMELLQLKSMKAKRLKFLKWSNRKNKNASGLIWLYPE